MSDATRKRILKALEGDYGGAHDNAYRFRSAFGRMSTDDLEREYGLSGRKRGDLLREAEAEEQAARTALLDFDPSWTPRRAFR